MPASRKRSVSNKGNAKGRKPLQEKRKPRRKRKPRKVNLGAWKAVGVACAVVLTLVVLFHDRGGSGNGETGAKVPPGDWRYGIDISHHNAGNIVWDSLYVLTDKYGRTIRNHHLAKDIRPVSFVFIKATEGVSMVDKDFKRNWNDAGRSGLRRGAYHFFRSSKEGEAQARLFIKTVGELSSSAGHRDHSSRRLQEKVERGGSEMAQDGRGSLRQEACHLRRLIFRQGLPKQGHYRELSDLDSSLRKRQAVFRWLDLVAVHRQGCRKRGSRFG